MSLTAKSSKFLLASLAVKKNKTAEIAKFFTEYAKLHFLSVLSGVIFLSFLCGKKINVTATSTEFFLANS